MIQNISDAHAPNPQLLDETLNKKVNALLAKMTLEEKVGQLVQFSSGAPTGPGTGRQSYDAMIAAGQVGALLNVADPKKANAFQHIAMEKSRLHIPLSGCPASTERHQISAVHIVSQP
jgi:beta-glucosidase